MSKAAGPMKKPIREFIRYSQWKIPEVNCGIASMCFVLKKQQKYSITINEQITKIAQNHPAIIKTSFSEAPCWINR